MSGPFGSQQWAYSSGGFYPLEIGQSARFENLGNSYLQRTPSVAGNRRTWTLSGWLKLTSLAGSGQVYSFLTSRPGSAEYVQLQYNENGAWNLFTRGSSGVALTSAGTTQVYRDFSSWYHVMLVMDTTQATASDRTKLYINGEYIAWGGSPTYPTLNEQLPVNNTTKQTFGWLDYAGSTTSYYDGYMAEINLVDGQALTPEDFGEFKSGVWVPKKYAGSYGTNGVRLDFANGAALGTDVSGNGNNFTPTNINANDQMLDSPTNNFCTFNSLDKSANYTLYQGNLQTTCNATHSSAKTTMFFDSGKWYAEFLIAAIGSGGMMGTATQKTSLANYLGATTGGVGYNWNGTKYVAGVATVGAGASFTTGDIIGVAVDKDAGTAAFYKNNVLQFTHTGMDSDPFCFGVGHLGSNIFTNTGSDSSFNANKTRQGNTDANGIGDFYYAPPTGYLAPCTANLPNPVAVIDPAVGGSVQDFFNTVLYTGNGTTQSITGVGFQPDWVWLKKRNNTSTHILADIVRGENRELSSDSTDAEGFVVGAYVTSFDTDGFSVGTNGNANGSGDTFVAWNWKMGGAAVANNDGTIASQVSANPDVGMSIVSYTGTAVAATLGHGIGKAPDLIIVKCRTATASWYVYNSKLAVDPATDYLVLDTTAAKLDNSTVWNDTEPTDSVFSIGNGVSTNAVGQDYIAYAFADVEGFSKAGTYTGNSSTDGPFVYCGFKPAYVLIKRTSNAADWVIKDAVRSSYNPAELQLYANLTNAEVVDDPFDFVSNGFKVREAGTRVNGSGNIYLFMAFSENPFKYGNAH